ncbi:MAG: TetR/AcrR family transcriptional regulator [Janthinobacterium lividum]
MGRPRSDTARQAVLDAAYDVLVERGISGFSVEAVATRSGVARTTIYRSWSSKGLLAVESLLAAFQLELAYAETGDTVADFRNLLASLVLVLSGPTGRIAASVLAEAQSDPKTRQAFLDKFSMPLRQQSGHILSRGIASGVFRRDLNVTVVLDATVGGAYLRLLMGQPLDAAWACALADTVLQGCFADTRPR